ncbi:unnamed protein product [Cunninghamella blakesleeana]
MDNENKIDKPFIRISICGNKPFIFNTEDVKRLRCDYHIVGSLQGTLARFPLQNSFYGLPLLLLPEEVVLILKKGWGKCIFPSSSLTLVKEKTQKWDYPKTIQDELKCKVYEYLWHQGYFITSGIKFGGDYIVYLGDPMKFHSHFIISVQEKNALWRLKDLITMGRLAKNTKKSFVLASSSSTNEDDSNQVECFSIVWAGF